MVHGVVCCVRQNMAEGAVNVVGANHLAEARQTGAILECDWLLGLSIR